MFGIGFFEILVIAVLGLLVFGPEKLPEAIRTFAFGFSKAKRSWQNTRRELEQELGMDEIRREIHNAQIMESMEKTKNNILNNDSTEEGEALFGEHIESQSPLESDDSEVATERSSNTPGASQKQQKTSSQPEAKSD